MRPFYLHIGTHMAGTAGLHGWLHDAAPRLAAKGTGLFIEGPAASAGTLPLANAVLRPSLRTPARMAGRTKPPGLWGRLKVLARLRGLCANPDIKRFVASAESLCFAREDVEAERLRWFFKVADVQIVPVVCFRNEMHWRAMWERELLKHGSHWRYGLGMDDIREDWVFDREEIVRFWRRFGSVRVVDYDREIEERGTVLPALLNAVGVMTEADQGRMYLDRSA
ncbi:hypothetical protein SAMN05421688_1278 [Poseidonocella pacifica]|uniref:Sulfotransferase family protein n=1 Tax=Poseidonocella pacifica TaxID=871651 RepID=A0A1I0WDD1_9RHOB|nr:hypothetical protein [Poseidonocella pacifica]SFA86407.1 hypothetical protein SAMN05421688_1278 [Poseidonocella pacifica]